MASSVDHVRVRAARLFGRRSGRTTAVRRRARVAAVSVLTVAAGLVPIGEDLGGLGARAYAAPVGQGFNLNPSDLKFILAQIKIAEHHADSFNAQNPCAGLVGPGPDQIPVGGNSV